MTSCLFIPTSCHHGPNLPSSRSTSLRTTSSLTKIRSTQSYVEKGGGFCALGLNVQTTMCEPVVTITTWGWYWSVLISRETTTMGRWLQIWLLGNLKNLWDLVLYNKRSMRSVQIICETRKSSSAFLNIFHMSAH
jgi:hypothetical protein